MYVFVYCFVYFLTAYYCSAIFIYILCLAYAMKLFTSGKQNRIDQLNNYLAADLEELFGRRTCTICLHHLSDEKISKHMMELIQKELARITYSNF